MNNDFAPFELAVKLKEKGFDYPCIAHYDINKELKVVIREPIFWHSDVLSYTDAPTIPQVLKWLREEKKIHLMIDIWKVNPNDINYKWGYDVVDLTTTGVVGCDTLCANTYEQAALAGISYVLDNLI